MLNKIKVNKLIELDDKMNVFIQLIFNNIQKISSFNKLKANGMNEIFISSLDCFNDLSKARIEFLYYSMQLLFSFRVISYDIDVKSHLKYILTNDFYRNERLSWLNVLLLDDCADEKFRI